ncbi:MAG: DUF3833 domain-containing protein [Alphaproteobacteria bacterium]|nr:DUF3833 domain-containing protein [Alphaproteobacteria bacterium]
MQQTAVTTEAPTRLRLEEFFLGRTRGIGIVEDRFGRLRRRFVCDMTGRWENDLFVLDETFAYADGARDHRVWRVRPGPDGRYEGHADDVIGTATGAAVGDTLAWGYVLRLPIGGRHHNIRFDDRMYLLADGLLLNRARMFKWGIRIAEVTLAFRRLER